MCSNIALFLNLVRAGLSYEEKDLQNKALFGEKLVTKLPEELRRRGGKFERFEYVERKLNKNKCKFRLCCFSHLNYLVLVKETVPLYKKKSTMHVFITSNHWIVQ